MGGPLDRTWYDSLVDDDGSGTTGTVWNKAQVDGFMDTIDAALLPLPVSTDVLAWTPVFQGSTGQTGQIYQTQTGYAIKTGRKVEAWFHLGLTTLGTITGNLYVGGLPYVASAANLAYHAGGAVAFFYLTEPFSSIIPLVPNASYAIGFWATAAGPQATQVQLSATALAATSQMMGYVTYLTA